MKQSVLPFLACPVRAGGALCAGSLSAVSMAGLALRASPEDPDEVLEGGLRCAACGTEYPVLSGAAVLLPRPDNYLRRYQRAILRDIDRHGQFSPEGRFWLNRNFSKGAKQDDYGADFRFSQQFEDPWTMAQAMAEDPSALYGPFAAWLRSVSGQGPYDVLASWAGELARERRLFLDAGCGGGGLLARAASRFRAAFGVDYSFLAVLLARRTVLHRPEPERSYCFSVRRGQEVERPLSVRRVENGEFVVGDCSAMPFAPGLFDVVCSTNMIDIAGLDASLDEGARVTRPGGAFLVTDPFYFRDGEAPPGDPRAALRGALERRGFLIEREQDAVPWAWATYDRHWRLYFNYCVAARQG